MVPLGKSCFHWASPQTSSLVEVNVGPFYSGTQQCGIERPDWDSIFVNLILIFVILRLYWPLLILLWNLGIAFIGIKSRKTRGNREWAKVVLFATFDQNLFIIRYCLFQCYTKQNLNFALVAEETINDEVIKLMKSLQIITSYFKEWY